MYVVPPLGAYKSQLGDTYLIAVVFYIVIDSGDYRIVGPLLYMDSCIHDTWLLLLSYNTWMCHIWLKHE